MKMPDTVKIACRGSWCALYLSGGKLQVLLRSEESELRDKGILKQHFIMRDQFKYHQNHIEEITRSNLTFLGN